MKTIYKIIYALILIFLLIFLLKKREYLKQLVENLLMKNENNESSLNQNNGFSDKTIEEIAIKIHSFIKRPFYQNDDEQAAINWVNSITRQNTWDKLKLKYALLYNSSLVSDLKTELSDEEFLNLKWRK